MKKKEKYLFYGLAIVAIAAVVLSAVMSYHIFIIDNAVQDNQEGAHGHMLLMHFDSQIAMQFMDKNNDGKCDSCGMAVEMCIEDGQMQCDMDTGSIIGVIGSGHSHADFKVYVNGKYADFANSEYYMKSRFMHVDDNVNKEDASGVLHMHAKGVPLWIFFESIGGRFNETCIAISDKQVFCNNASKSLKFYVNGNPNNGFGNYAFNQNDKILISFGDVNEDIQYQLEAVTDFSRDH
ncbi:MAG: hypothetical protein HZB65_01605 [Candidatus Aenigmarchaeota archaeon]|nr:hypothetical protein [Candidatus Aenigmarchaeota archaeon]